MTEAVYGGCKMNGVKGVYIDNENNQIVETPTNSLVLVEGGEHTGVGIFGGCDISGNVSGESRVVVTGGTVGDAYGGGNGDYNYTSGPYAGLDKPFCNASRIDITGGEATNLFAGGLNGESGATTTLIGGGTVTEKVFGGGDRAGVVIVDTNPDPEITENTTGNSTIEMTGGTVLQGIYGGCNATGAIEGDVEMAFTGGTVGATGAGNGGQIFVGGYGQSTTVAGNVLINFGEDNNTQSDYPLLIGDLYGGSALGSVNTNSASPNAVVNTTTINVFNGTITGPVTGNPIPSQNIYGNVFGGGLGQKAVGGNPAIAAVVHGVVNVNIGKSVGTNEYSGKATLNNCNVFGCNNQYGSPQDDVYVDVYQTNHTATDAYDYLAPNIDDAYYAIYQVFGGGNQTDYAPENDDHSSTKETHVYIHGCENTIRNVFGASNAANAISVRTEVDGGRFYYIFGGGNGTTVPANVGYDENIHETYSRVYGGRAGFYFGGSNMNGTCMNIDQTDPENPETSTACGTLVITNLYNGGNIADEYSDLTLNLMCTDNKTYDAAYGGCRLGSVWGNITVNMYGGTIGNLYGGCQGDEGYIADVKRRPTLDEINANPDDYPSALKTFLEENPGLYGTGGDITINVYGGTIGNVIGGCNHGNVEGKITINVYENVDDCPLFIGNVYGANNLSTYHPENPALLSPEINIKKVQHIGGTATFNGSSQNFDGNVFGGGNAGDVICHPRVNIGPEAAKTVIIGGSVDSEGHAFGTTNYHGGNVYGGSDSGNVTGSPKVTIGKVGNDSNVTVKGNVYGGGNEGNVTGSPQVIIVPTE